MAPIKLAVSAVNHTSQLVGEVDQFLKYCINRDVLVNKMADIKFYLIEDKEELMKTRIFTRKLS